MVDDTGAVRVPEGPAAWGVPLGRMATEAPMEALATSGARAEHKEWLPVTKLGSLIKDMKISPWRRFMSSFCPSGNLWSLTFSWWYLSETRFWRLCLYKSRPVLASRTGSRHLSPMGSQPRASREAASAIHGAIILTKLPIIMQWGYWRNWQDQQAWYCFLQGDLLLWFCTDAPHTCRQEPWHHLCPKTTADGWY